MSGSKLFVSYAIQPAYQETIAGIVQGNLSKATLIEQPQITPRDRNHVNLNMSFQVNSDWSLQQLQELRVNGTQLMEVTITKK